MSAVIEVLAIETSGLDPARDCILEVGLARRENGKWDGETFLLQTPPGLQLSPEIVAYHTQTGLWADMRAGKRVALPTVEPLKPAALRVLWASSFAAPFLRGTVLAPFQGAEDFGAVCRLARVLRGCPVAESMRRAGPKVREMVRVLRSFE